MGRIEKTVFISYRRTNLPWALAVYQHLTSQGYDVFFDYLSIPSGDFEKIIVENIKGRAHFLVILTPSALERCHEPGDWLRREIETAIAEKRNIVPLMVESFDFGSPATVKALTGNLENLKKYNALRIPSEYFFEAMDRLREQFLNVTLDAVVQPISDDAKKSAEEQQIAASETRPVEQQELTAQDWFERGYVFQKAKILSEAIRCYTEAIHLKPDFAKAYFNRGVARRAKGDDDGAKEDYDKAVHLNPDLSVGLVPKRFALIGGIMMIVGIGSFAYFVISFIGLIFSSLNQSNPPDFSRLQFSLIPIGIVLFLIGTAAGGMSVVIRMRGIRSAKK